MDIGWVIAIGVVAVAVMVWAGLHESGRVREAARPTAIRFATSEQARDAVDRAAVKMRLHRTGWRENGDGWIEAMYPLQKSRDPYRIEADVDASGRLHLVLVPEGSSREFAMGFIPIGPSVPFGTGAFLRLVKLLRNTMTAAGPSAPAPPTVPVRRGAIQEPTDRPDATLIRDNPGREDAADETREAIIAAFGAQRRCSFGWIDRRAGGDLLATLAVLRDLVEEGELVREPGGIYRITRNEGEST